MTFHRIAKFELAYVNEKGIRRVGLAIAVTEDGEFFKVLHKAGYTEIVDASRIVAR